MKKNNRYRKLIFGATFATVVSMVLAFEEELSKLNWSLMDLSQLMHKPLLFKATDNVNSLGVEVKKYFSEYKRCVKKYSTDKCLDEVVKSVENLAEVYDEIVRHLYNIFGSNIIEFTENTYNQRFFSCWSTLEEAFTELFDAIFLKGQLSCDVLDKVYVSVELLRKYAAQKEQAFDNIAVKTLFSSYINEVVAGLEKLLQKNIHMVLKRFRKSERITAVEEKLKKIHTMKDLQASSFRSGKGMYEQVAQTLKTESFCARNRILENYYKTILKILRFEYVQQALLTYDSFILGDFDLLNFLHEKRQTTDKKWVENELKLMNDSTSVTTMISDNLGIIFSLLNIEDSVRSEGVGYAVPKTKLNLDKSIKKSKTYKLSPDSDTMDTVIEGANAFLSAPLWHMFDVFRVAVHLNLLTSEEVLEQLTAVLQKIEQNPVTSYPSIRLEIDRIKVRLGVGSEEALPTEEGQNEAIKNINDIIKKYKEVENISLLKVPADKISCKTLIKTYHKLALIVHPDKRGDKEGRDFKMLKEAYDNLEKVCHKGVL